PSALGDGTRADRVRGQCARIGGGWFDPPRMARSLSLTRSAIIAAHYRLQESIAVITLDNPPVNGLGFDTRVEAAAGIDRALADTSVTALVLTGGSKLFSAGADIREFNTP